MSSLAQWQLEAIHVTDCVEWHAATNYTARGISPGHATIENERRILYFSPRYLLAINHHETAPALAVNAGAVPVEVTGKWCGFRLLGTHARDVLSAGAHTDLLLNDRACAALVMFDCPVVLLRTDAVDEVWVATSYADSLCDALITAEKML